MIVAIFPTNVYEELRNNLLADSRETCAILLASTVRDGRRTRLLVRHAIYPEASDYRMRSEHRVELNAEFVARSAKMAKAQQLSLVVAHSHPDGSPRFSEVDDAGEAVLGAFLQRRCPQGVHVSLVLSPSGASARVLGTTQAVVIRHIGVVVHEVDTEKPTDSDQVLTPYERQIRLFGKRAQVMLGKVRVGIVGLGGTGSLVAQQLAYLGVRDFVLVDHDVIEESNLNRVVGAFHNDIGAAKTAVAERHIRSIQGSARVKTIQADLLNSSVSRVLKNVDFLFSCTDTIGSRAVINQLSYQYYIPTIDMGVSIGMDRERKTITGRVQMLSPGLACLVCGNLLDSDQVRRDLMSAEELKHDPYFLGVGEPQPAVISINSTVASLAITMFLSAVAGIPSRPRLLLYDGVNGSLRNATIVSNPDCIVCSKHGALGRGNEWDLPRRPS